MVIEGRATHPPGKPAPLDLQLIIAANSALKQLFMDFVNNFALTVTTI
jgi:hypothetical protein